MKLYYSPGSCSTSCHISLEEAGIKYEAIEVDFENASDSNIALTAKLNPLGTLPVATLDSGKVLSQNISIHMYAASQAPEKELLPKYGTVEFAEAMNWLSFVASDLHKSFSPLFGASSISSNAAAQSEIKKYAAAEVNRHLAYLNKHLEGKEYILGSKFSVVDAYCFVVVGWTKWVEIPTTPYSNVEAYLKRVSQRPAVAKVLKEEGLN